MQNQPRACVTAMQPSKKKYSSPRLSVLGDVGLITKGFGRGWRLDATFSSRGRRYLRFS